MSTPFCIPNQAIHGDVPQKERESTLDAFRYKIYAAHSGAPLPCLTTSGDTTPVPSNLLCALLIVCAPFYVCAAIWPSREQEGHAAVPGGHGCCSSRAGHSRSGPGHPSATTCWQFVRPSESTTLHHNTLHRHHKSMLHYEPTPYPAHPIDDNDSDCAPLFARRTKCFARRTRRRTCTDLAALAVPSPRAPASPSTQNNR